MFLEVKNYYTDFKYTVKVLFKDGTSKTSETKRGIKFGTFTKFNNDISMWDRQGKSMRTIECSPIKGYNYWTTEEQDKFNKASKEYKKIETEYVTL